MCANERFSAPDGSSDSRRAFDEASNLIEGFGHGFCVRAPCFQFSAAHCFCLKNVLAFVPLYIYIYIHRHYRDGRYPRDLLNTVRVYADDRHLSHAIMAL